MKNQTNNNKNEQPNIIDVYKKVKSQQTKSKKSTISANDIRKIIEQIFKVEQTNKVLLRDVVKTIKEIYFPQQQYMYVRQRVCAAINKQDFNYIIETKDGVSYIKKL